MSIPGSALPLLLASSAGAAGDGIERSLRFNSPDDANLSKTFASAGNRKTWTWAGWVKRSLSGAARQAIFAGHTGSAANYTTIEFLNDNLVFFFNANATGPRTSALFRDPTAWLHVCVALDTTQATAADRVKIYVNGTQQTIGTGSYPNQNTDLQINANSQHNIGSDDFYDHFDGYLADVHFIDGQALDPTDFGEFDDNGVWQPIEYAGTYGTNGFHLPFNDNSSASALGTDDSGNGNDWTVNNISVASGAGNDSLLDSPTNGNTANDTGAGGEVPGNYCTWSAINKHSSHTLTQGNLSFAGSTSSTGRTLGTFAVSSGKWYWEATPTSNGGEFITGIVRIDDVSVNWINYIGGTAYSYGYSSSYKYNNDTYALYGASIANNDVIGVALDLDAGTLTFYKNGVSQGVAFSGLSGTYYPGVSDLVSSRANAGDANFGQRPFAYSAPSGYKCLCTANLDTPTIEDGSTAMDVALWTGNGATSRAISGLGFSPDFVWIKQRNNSRNHGLFDALRGATKALYGDGTDTETTFTGSLISFDSDGFSVGSSDLTNGATGTYAGWAWDAGSSTVTNTDGSITSSVRANPTAGFSVVTYTGNGSTSGTIGHGLGVEPHLIIIKSRNVAANWVVYHEFCTPPGATNPAKNALYLNLANAPASNNNYPWNSTAPSSSVFTVSAYSSLLQVNVLNSTYVAYCFAPVESYSAFGSYTGNGNTDGPFVYTGHRPRWILRKRSDNTGNWGIVDADRLTYNLDDTVLFPDLNYAEQTLNPNWGVDILSNGFKVRSSNAATNASGGTYVYVAFAESPQKYARAR